MLARFIPPSITRNDAATVRSYVRLARVDEVTTEVLSWPAEGEEADGDLRGGGAAAAQLVAVDAEHRGVSGRLAKLGKLEPAAIIAFTGLTLFLLVVPLFVPFSTTDRSATS